MPSFTPPEITASDLSQLVLELAVWGVKDPRTLSWLDPPPQAAWIAGMRLLKDLGALDASGSVTSAGRAMARLPLHPRLSRLMLKASEAGCTRLGTDLVALLTERDIFRGGAAGSPADPDVSERIEVLYTWRRGETADGRVDTSAIRNVERTSKQLLRMMPGSGKDAVEESVNQTTVSRLLLSAFPDRICKRRDEGGGHFVHMQGRGVRLSPNSHLGSSPYLIAVYADAGEKAEGFVHIASPITEELIRGECGERIETVRRLEWDRNEGRIVAVVEDRLEALMISTRPFTPTD